MKYYKSGIRDQNMSISQIASGLKILKWGIYQVLTHGEDFKLKSRSGRLQVISFHDEGCIRNLASIKNYSRPQI